MKDLLLFPILFIISILFAIKLFHRASTKHNNNLPPSPPSLPILGHLHLLNHPLHQCFFDLSQKYGSIFSLRLGSRLTMVVSSPSLVTEVFNKNDIIFANRPTFWGGKYIGYDNTNVGLSPYGEHWRNLRRIGTRELFSPNRIKLSSGIRREETMRFLKTLYDASSNDKFVKFVELRPMLTTLAFNMILRTITGKRIEGDSMIRSKEEARFQELIGELTNLGASGFIGDFIPSLQWIDFSGYKKNLVKIANDADEMVQRLVDDHRLRRRRKAEDDSDNEMISMIDSLLSSQELQPEYYTDDIIKGLLQDMLIAGTDTTATTIEWAMANLLNNVPALNKTRAELDNYLGKDEFLDETDLPKLCYLKKVVAETLRLKPVSPVLLPHMNSENCTIGNYHIPKGSMLFVNACAIQRDPKLWDEPMSFRPERFEESDVNYQGNPKMIPFGMGRRSCPGIDLGPHVVRLVLGLLIQCFEWKSVDENGIDMAEGSGVTMRKAKPLEVMFKPRNIANKLLS